MMNSHPNYKLLLELLNTDSRLDLARVEELKKLLGPVSKLIEPEELDGDFFSDHISNFRQYYGNELFQVISEKLNKKNIQNKIVKDDGYDTENNSITIQLANPDMKEKYGSLIVRKALDHSPVKPSVYLETVIVSDKFYIQSYAQLETHLVKYGLIMISPGSDDLD